ncbi:MAG: DUF3828 domain-containing protein [Pyrinomonadaceae bacterium]
MRSNNIFNLMCSAVLMFAGLACSSGGNVNVAVTDNTDPNVASTPSGTPAAGAEQSQAAAAEALVADLYRQHDAKKSPFFQTKNRALVDKYFAKPLADLIWKDANDSKDEVGALDSDPLYNTQDPDIKNFAIGHAQVSGESATVSVTFNNGGLKQSLTFALKLINGAWKIEDIKSSPQDSLRKYLASSNVPPAGDHTGVFEGTYQVGDTTCTVTPAKMGFEVRWAKGSGVEMYFSNEPTTFESSADKGIPNIFDFADTKYDNGTFQRSDGKPFAVKRLR